MSRIEIPLGGDLGLLDTMSTIEILSLVCGLPADKLEELAPLFTAPALRARRVCERDDAIRALASAMAADSGRALAKAIHRDLARYATSAWRFERGRPPPADPMRGLWHATLTAARGRPPSVSTIRRALAGVGGGSKFLGF